MGILDQVFLQGLTNESKMLPKKPKPNQLLPSPRMDEPEWEAGFLEAISAPSEEFTQGVEDNWNLRSSVLNTPESELANPFDYEEHLFNSAEPGEIITVMVDNIESPVPKEAIVLANQEEAPEPKHFPENEWGLWGFNNNQDEELISAPPMMVEGIAVSSTQAMEQFENEFDESVFEQMSQEEEIKPEVEINQESGPSTKFEQKPDLLESIINLSSIPQNMDIVQQQENNMEDPDWKPEGEIPEFYYERKNKLHLVEKPKKRRVGRPCRTEPIKITELPPGIRKGSHKLSHTSNVQLTPEQIDQLRYRRMRDLNNEASKKCRANRKTKLEIAEEQLVQEEAKHHQLAKMVKEFEQEADKYKNWASNFFGYIPVQK